MTDWNTVLDQSADHCMVPLVSRQLAATCSDLVPAPVREELQRLERQAGARAMTLTRELILLLPAFRDAGIPVMCLKGPVLAQLLYGTVAMRDFEDLDLLVRRRDVARAAALLASAGYRSRRPLTPGQEALLFDVDYHRQLVNAERGIHLELHWAFSKKGFDFRFDEDWWWDHTMVVSVAGAEVSTLSDEALLLYLCVHGSKHRWVSVSWIADITDFVDRFAPRLDWPMLLRVASNHGSLRMLLLGLALAEGAGAELPDPVSELVRADRNVMRLASRIRRDLFDHEAGAPGAWTSTLFHLRLRPGIWPKARYAFLIGTTPHADDISFVALPHALRGLYFLVRPLRVVVRRWQALSARRPALKAG